jgi:ABC-type dipeptide/oligopeptide/nickel transport system permease component
MLISFTGAQSSGKTTSLNHWNDCRNHWNVVPEVTRKLKRRGFEINDDGSKDGVIYQTEFSGILTGNLGKSYTYAEPVTEVMKPRFKVSIFLKVP